MNPYRQRIWSQLEPILRACGPLVNVLDFGSGDGWFASQARASHIGTTLTPVDIKRREHVFVEPTLYAPDAPLPFANRHFDLVYAVDVLHHCSAPFKQLDELCRVSGRYLLIKDHTYSSKLGQWALAVLDEVGNRRFGIPSPYHYQLNWAWRTHLTEIGWQEVRLIHPCRCHTGPLGLLTNHLQFIALYERKPD